MSRQVSPCAGGLQALLEVLLRLRADRCNHLPGFAEPILIYLGAWADRPVRMGELREQLGLGQSRASRLCAALERAGLIEIGTAAEDRRTSWLRLTPAGSQLIDDCARGLQDLIEGGVGAPAPGLDSGPGSRD